MNFILLSAITTLAILSNISASPQSSLNNNRESSLLLGTINRRDDPSHPNTPLSFTKGNNTGRPSQGFPPLPPGYNKLIIPKLNNTTFITVLFYISIHSVTNVDEVAGVLELDTEIGLEWVDWKIWAHLLQDEEAKESLRNAPHMTNLNPAFLNSIWNPDVFIEQLVSVDTTYLLVKPFFLAFFKESANTKIIGSFKTHSRQLLRIRCEMDFTYYPADTQSCPIHIHSYVYDTSDFALSWSKWQKVQLDGMKDPNFDFQVSDVEPGEELNELITEDHEPCCSSQNYSTLTFTIKVRRNLTYHIVQTFLPSILFILITWLCFLLPHEMVEIRIGISMTTLLTIIAMFGAVRSQGPKVSYTMGLDMWMLFCILLIFLALALFTFTYWMQWRFLRNTYKTENESEIVEEDKDDDEEPTVEKPPKKIYMNYISRSRYTFIFFAGIFGLFLLVFGFGLMFSSGYNNWAPSSKYNAVPDKNGITTRLYSRHTIGPSSPNGSVEDLEYLRVEDLHVEIQAKQKEFLVNETWYKELEEEETEETELASAES